MYKILASPVEVAVFAAGGALITSAGELDDPHNDPVLRPILIASADPIPDGDGKWPDSSLATFSVDPLGGGAVASAAEIAPSQAQEIPLAVSVGGAAARVDAVSKVTYLEATPGNIGKLFDKATQFHQRVIQIRRPVPIEGQETGVEYVEVPLCIAIPPCKAVPMPDHMDFAASLDPDSAPRPEVYTKVVKAKKDKLTLVFRLQDALPMVCPYLGALKGVAEMGTEKVYEQFNDLMMPLWFYNDITAKRIMKEFETVRLVNKLMRGQPLSDDESASFGDNIEMFRGNAIYHLESMKMIKAINPEASLAKFHQYLNDFFDYCAYEKKADSDVATLERVKRIISGGCMTMVSGFSAILGLNEDALLSSEVGDLLREMMLKMGAATVDFNDPISADKEYRTEGETTKPYLKDTDTFTEWATEKFQSYNAQLVDLYKLKEKVAEEFPRLRDRYGEESEKLIQDIQLYVLLIESAISGLAMWSLDLTQRYDPKKDTIPVQGAFDQYEGESAIGFEAFKEVVSEMEKERGYQQRAGDIVDALQKTGIPLTAFLDVNHIAGFLSEDPSRKDDALASVRTFWETLGVPQQKIAQIIEKLISLPLESLAQKDIIMQEISEISPELGMMIQMMSL